jgi:hypothetical protein
MPEELVQCDQQRAYYLGESVVPALGARTFTFRCNSPGTLRIWIIFVMLLY